MLRPRTSAPVEITGGLSTNLDDRVLRSFPHHTFLLVLTAPDKRTKIGQHGRTTSRSTSKLCAHNRASSTPQNYCNRHCTNERRSVPNGSCATTSGTAGAPRAGCSRRKAISQPRSIGSLLPQPSFRFCNRAAPARRPRSRSPENVRCRHRRPFADWLTGRGHRAVDPTPNMSQQP